VEVVSLRNTLNCNLTVGYVDTMFVRYNLHILIFFDVHKHNVERCKIRKCHLLLFALIVQSAAASIPCKKTSRKHNTILANKSNEPLALL